MPRIACSLCRCPLTRCQIETSYHLPLLIVSYCSQSVHSRSTQNRRSPFISLFLHALGYLLCISSRTVITINWMIRERARENRTRYVSKPNLFESFGLEIRDSFQLQFLFPMLIRDFMFLKIEIGPRILESRPPRDSVQYMSTCMIFSFL